MALSDLDLWQTRGVPANCVCGGWSFVYLLK
jgi:hypothetical protein